MSVLKTPRVIVTNSALAALMVLVGASAVMAQASTAKPPSGQAPTAKPATPAPTTQQPAAPAPAAQTPPAAAATPPKPFPEGAKIAYVDVQAIASNSIEGKAATAKLAELQKKKTAELAEKNKQLQATQTKLQQGGSVLNDQARSQLEKEIEKLNRDIQFFQQDANTEIQDLQNQLQGDFQDKLNPVLMQVGSEKGLHYIVDVRTAGLVWWDTGLDITAEVIRRFDAAPKTPVKK